jgi:hypothetical protein
MTVGPERPEKQQTPSIGRHEHRIESPPGYNRRPLPELQIGSQLVLLYLLRRLPRRLQTDRATRVTESKGTQVQLESESESELMWVLLHDHTRATRIECPTARRILRRSIHLSVVPQSWDHCACCMSAREWGSESRQELGEGLLSRVASAGRTTKGRVAHQPAASKIRGPGQ